MNENNFQSFALQMSHVLNIAFLTLVFYFIRPARPSADVVTQAHMQVDRFSFCSVKCWVQRNCDLLFFCLSDRLICYFCVIFSTSTCEVIMWYLTHVKMMKRTCMYFVARVRDIIDYYWYCYEEYSHNDTDIWKWRHITYIRTMML